MKTSNKKGLLIIGALILISIAVLVFTGVSNDRKNPTRNLIVYVNGARYLTSPLKDGEAITVTQEDGSENVIRMTSDGFYMESSTCPHHECIDQGPVTLENWKTRKLLEQVICLPNRVTVVLELTDLPFDPNVPDF